MAIRLSFFCFCMLLLLPIHVVQAGNFDGCNACMRACMPEGAMADATKATQCMEVECKPICEREQEQFRQKAASAGECGESCGITYNAILDFCRTSQRIPKEGRPECYARANMHYVNCIDICTEEEAQ